MNHYEVVAAVICCNGKILCTQRAASQYAYTSFKYEFPGGKIESGETPQEALLREISEELGCLIVVGKHLMTVQHTYPDFAITMHAYHCTFALESSLVLHEHLAAVWLEPSRLAELDWAAADVPIIRSLQ